MAVERMKLRLDKYLADMGLGTRSQIKKDISKGQVLVNGTVSKDAGTRIDTEKDQVSYLGQAVTYAEYEYYMLNKTAGVVSATEDRHDRTVLDLIDTKQRKDLFPVGARQVAGRRKCARRRRGLRFANGRDLSLFPLQARQLVCRRVLFERKPALQKHGPLQPVHRDDGPLREFLIRSMSGRCFRAAAESWERRASRSQRLKRARRFQARTPREAAKLRKKRAAAKRVSLRRSFPFKRLSNAYFAE